MSALRRILAQLCFAGVLSQAIGIMLPPAVLWATSETPECTCAVGDHAMCPMHHHYSRTGCAMRAAADDGTAILGPLALAAVLPGRSSTAIAAPVASVTGMFAIDHVAERFIAPDSPPPRV